MSGALLAAQETAAARVQTLGQSAAARLMKNAIDARRGTIKGITLIAPLMETDRYLVLSLPRKTIAQLSAYLSSLPAERREPFVSSWVSKNNLSLIVQHAKAGSPSRFDFKTEPIPGYASHMPARPAAPMESALRRAIPRQTAPVRRKTIEVAEPPIRPREMAPALKPIPARLRPAFDEKKRIITIPVPSNKPDGSRLHWKIMKPNMIFGERVLSVPIGLEFVASKASGRVEGRDLAKALVTLIYPYLVRRVRLELQSTTGRFSSAALQPGVVRSLQSVSQPDVKRYLGW
ncbi:MAG: hypothetical protein AB1295_03760 [Candidatus Micrarchaeota archaeon]